VPIGSNRSDRSIRGNVVAVHLPHRDLALGVLPQDVGFAVAAEVADGGDVPVGTDRSDRSVGSNMVAIHLPHRDLAAIAVQENVGFAASAEVSFGLQY
jgi:hypothetical protein